MCQILTPECYTNPPTCINFKHTVCVGRFDMWVTPKTNRPSFCLILKLSHPLNGLFSVLSRLRGHKHKCAFCWMKDHWIWLLSDIVVWDSFWQGTHNLFSYKCCDSHFPCFGKYIFPQLQTYSADCTEGSCSSNMPSNF